MRLLQAALLIAFSTPPVAHGGATMTVKARNFHRRTIYHSPQTPGFTCWCGLWKMPDGSVMCCFTQATGPTRGWRPKAPPEVRKRLGWPPTGIEGYDMTGLILENVHLRSTDGGETWEKVSADPFTTCMNGCTGEGEVALREGTVIRAVWGQYLPFWHVPQTGYMQRSTDGTKTWGPPELLTENPNLMTFPKLVRRLADGRIVVTGATAPGPIANWQRMALEQLRPCIWVSTDAIAKKWSAPLPAVPQRPGFWTEEFDVAELPGGDLLAVYRTNDAKNHPRQQNVIAKKGDTWEPGPVRDAPFPHSGHPEVLATKEGLVVHIATSGTSWTADAGKTWATLDGVPSSAYYPRSVQLDDGTIMVVGHAGGDDPYGVPDQSIVMDTYKITVMNNGDQR
jgi:hypothetical protein